MCVYEREKDRERDKEMCRREKIADLDKQKGKQKSNVKNA